MKYWPILAMALGVMFCVTGSAEVSYKNWANTDATPAPVRDAARPDGYWWWPTTPSANEGDRVVWGNYGTVYGLGMQVKPPEKPKPEPRVERPPIHGDGKPIFCAILFEKNKSVLDAAGQAETDRFNAYLKKYPKDLVTVEGHTDDTESPAHKMELGLARANAVRKYMVEQGIAAERITVKSFGDTQPAVPNDSDANRKINRRVMFDATVVN